jgi:hypothetical protein
MLFDALECLSVDLSPLPPYPYARFTGLPKVGSSDPFFVAKLDGGIKFMCVFDLIELAQYLMISLRL